MGTHQVFSQQMPEDRRYREAHGTYRNAHNFLPGTILKQNPGRCRFTMQDWITISGQHHSQQSGASSTTQATSAPASEGGYREDRTLRQSGVERRKGGKSELYAGAGGGLPGAGLPATELGSTARRGHVKTPGLPELRAPTHSRPLTLPTRTHSHPLSRPKLWANCKCAPRSTLKVPK